MKGIVLCRQTIKKPSINARLMIYTLFISSKCRTVTVIVANGVVSNSRFLYCHSSSIMTSAHLKFLSVDGNEL